MNVQLLLLLALVGSFCAFTHANPTPLPTTQLDVTITEETAPAVADATEAPKEELTVFTGPPSTAVAAAPGELATVAVTAAQSANPAPANTEEPEVETEAPTAAATAAAEVTEAEPEPEVLHTDPPAVVTAAPTVAAKTEEEPVATAGAKVDEGGDEVLVEDEGLTSGQVVGIVIGALLAVIIVIAVVIAAVRRMGKYSP